MGSVFQYTFSDKKKYQKELPCAPKALLFQGFVPGIDFPVLIGAQYK